MKLSKAQNFPLGAFLKLSAAKNFPLGVFHENRENREKRVLLTLVPLFGNLQKARIQTSTKKGVGREKNNKKK